MVPCAQVREIDNAWLSVNLLIVISAPILEKSSCKMNQQVRVIVIITTTTIMKSDTDGMVLCVGIVPRIRFA